MQFSRKQNNKTIKVLVGRCGGQIRRITKWVMIKKKSLDYSKQRRIRMLKVNFNKYTKGLVIGRLENVKYKGRQINIGL